MFIQRPQVISFTKFAPIKKIKQIEVTAFFTDIYFTIFTAKETGEGGGR